jgi:translation initiation factor eIF-2B subunit alpha
LALVANALNKPFYVAVESYKFARMYPLTQRDTLQQAKNPFSAIPTLGKLPSSQQSQLASIQATTQASQSIINELDMLRVDFTPAKLITLLFTDLGVLTPAAVSDELIKLYQ